MTFAIGEVGQIFGNTSTNYMYNIIVIIPIVYNMVEFLGGYGIRPYNTAPTPDKIRRNDARIVPQTQIIDYR